MKKWLSINYGINRKVEGHHVRRKSIQHINGKLRIKGDWELPETHTRIREMIQQRHPKWSVTGWCLAKGLEGGVYAVPPQARVTADNASDIKQKALGQLKLADRVLVAIDQRGIHLRKTLCVTHHGESGEVHYDTLPLCSFSVSKAEAARDFFAAFLQMLPITNAKD